MMEIGDRITIIENGGDLKKRNLGSMWIGAHGTLSSMIPPFNRLSAQQKFDCPVWWVNAESPTGHSWGGNHIQKIWLPESCMVCSDCWSGRGHPETISTTTTKGKEQHSMLFAVTIMQTKRNELGVAGKESILVPTNELAAPDINSAIVMVAAKNAEVVGKAADDSNVTLRVLARQLG